MKLHRHALSALALFAGLPMLSLVAARPAEAGLGVVMQANGSPVRASSEHPRERVVATELDILARPSAEP